MAKPRSGTNKKRSTASTKQRERATESVEAPARELDGADSILVVQFSEPDPIPPGDIETFVAEVIGGALATTKTRPKGDGTWPFFLATERPHPAARHCWLGIGAGVPPKSVDAIQAGLETHGCGCGREYAVIAHHALRPLFVLTADGIEVPIGASSPSDATLGRLTGRVSRKPFVVELADLFKKDLLSSMLLGDGRPFQLRYFQEDSLALIRFGRVDLQMFASHGDGSFTAMTKYAAEPPCVLGFDFVQPQLAELLRLLPEHAAEKLLETLAQGRPFRVPAGTVVVGVSARPQPPDGTEGSSFVVEHFVSSAGGRLVAEF